MTRFHAVIIIVIFTFVGSIRFDDHDDVDDGVQKVVDFAEVDPFKDFRYEDVFNIEDPFADEADQLEKNSSSMDEIFATSQQHTAGGRLSFIISFSLL